MASVKKDPQAKLDYGLDWTRWLPPGDTIVASTWTVTGPDASLVASTPSFSGTQTGVWLAGGTADQTYEATNHIVTQAGREDERTLTVRVVQR